MKFYMERTDDGNISYAAVDTTLKDVTEGYAIYVFETINKTAKTDEEKKLIKNGLLNTLKQFLFHNIEEKLCK